MAKEKTNSGLVDYVERQIGKPYWYGTYGQFSTLELLKQKRAQYPKMYAQSDFEKQIGQYVHDCVGLIKAYLWKDTVMSKPIYNSKQDVNATGMYNHCNKKGKIDSFPKVRGMLVFRGTNGKMSHVGVYVGPYVVEAKGHAYGVVRTNFNAKHWQYWGQCEWIKQDTAEYVKPTENAPKDDSVKEEKPKYKKGKTYVTIVDALNVRYEPSIKAKKVSYNNLTANAKLHAYHTKYDSGALKKDTKVTCVDVATDSDGNIWLKIPSGYVAAHYNGKVYIK